MSPRKSRKVEKTDSADESTMDMGSMKQPVTPSAFSRSLRTRKTKPKIEETSVIDEIAQSPQLNQSKLPSKKGRSKKTNSTADVIDDSMNVTVTSSKKRTRKTKIPAILVEDTTVINENENQSTDVSPAKKSKKKRTTSKKKSVKKQVSEETKENENIVTESTQYDTNTATSEDDEVAHVSEKIVEKQNFSPPSNARFKQLRTRPVSSTSIVDVTPESSPITVILTPHRTTKTPRKSPISIGSPKTHTLSPERLSKTPRKLSITSKSPVPSENSSASDTSLKMSSKKKKSHKSEKHHKVPSLRNSSSPSIVKKHFKTPKIVLRRSKSKSPISKSPLSEKIKKFSPKKSLTPKKSPINMKKKIEASIINDIENGRSPRLVLQRVTAPNTPSMFDETTKETVQSVSPTSLSPRRNLESEQPTGESVTPIKPILTTRFHSIAKGLTPTHLGTPKSEKLSSSTPREKSRRSLNLSGCSILSVDSFYGASPRTSTRLYDEKSANIANESCPLISEDDDSFNISGIKKANNSTDDTEKNDKDGTYELDEPKTPNLKKKKSKNNTYDLDEPKTPALKKKAEKRSMVSSKGENNTEAVIPKRVCKVRFASPSLDDTVEMIPKRAKSSRSGTPASKNVYKKTVDNDESVQRRRSNSLSRLNMKTPTSQIKKRSSSVVDMNRGKSSAAKAQNESVNRLSKPRLSLTAEKNKSENAKPLSARKIPNFAQIHQKKFERMESLVDAKKRVEERHNVLTNNVLTTSTLKNIDNRETGSAVKQVKKPSPKQPGNNGNYTRFGFKLRKPEATKMITKQPMKAKIQEKKEAKREILKGVRSNRRFELMMKSRNINK